MLASKYAHSAKSFVTTGNRPAMPFRGRCRNEKYCADVMSIGVGPARSRGTLTVLAAGPWPTHAPVARGDLESEFVVADADVVAIVQRGGGTDPLVLHMHAVR